MGCLLSRPRPTQPLHLDGDRKSTAPTLAFSAHDHASHPQPQSTATGAKKQTTSTSTSAGTVVSTSGWSRLFSILRRHTTSATIAEDVPGDHLHSDASTSLAQPRPTSLSADSNRAEDGELDPTEVGCGCAIPRPYY